MQPTLYYHAFEYLINYKLKINWVCAIVPWFLLFHVFCVHARTARHKRRRDLYACNDSLRSHHSWLVSLLTWGWHSTELVAWYPTCVRYFLPYRYWLFPRETSTGRVAHPVHYIESFIVASDTESTQNSALFDCKNFLLTFASETVS